MKYAVNDKVVFKYEGTNQVGIITNIRSAKMGGGYDIRSEKGSGFVMVPVDPTGNGEKAKFRRKYAYIDSALTTAIANDIDTNLYVNKNLGHTRANYGKNVELRIDGQEPGYKAVGHFERYNDFIFPPQGPRSF
jgi:hypothetical protein|tara:strand:+ start:232 stop:633 length:402 start_codon:yes stop_codon:yes gene_type:complete